MSWYSCEQRSIGVTCSLAEIAHSSVAQMKPESLGNRFLKNAMENDISPSSTRSNSPSICASDLFDRSTTTGSVASPATVNTCPISELHITEQFEKPPDCNDQFSEHSYPRGLSIPELRNPSGSSLPDATVDAGEKQSPIARGPVISNAPKGRHINITRLPGDGRPEETDSDFDDDDLDSDGEELYNNEWSGEPDRIETAVLANVEDLEFAAWLIMELHKDQMLSEEQRIGGWQRGVANCQGSSGSGESQGQTSMSSYGDQTSANSRKRRRVSESDDRCSDDGDREEREDGDGNGSPANQDGGLAPGGVTRRYACPFNKLNPARFRGNSTSENEFRICESGFKNIQRVKEHIKRKHVVIQCERCFRNFSKKNMKKEESVAELAKHRREPEPCALGNPREANLGINMDQESLLNESRGKKRQKVSDVDKWFNIWKIIFLNIPQPSHPWVEATTLGRIPRPASDSAQGYLNMVQISLERYTSSGFIQFSEGQQEEMMSRVISLVQSLYNIHADRNGTPSLVNTSSGGQTETQTLMPMTPSMEPQNLNMAHQQVPGPKINEHRSQTMMMPDLHSRSTPMNIDSQSPFGMLQPQNTVNMAYVPQAFPTLYGNQLSRVSTAHVPGPSGTLAGLTLESEEYGWPFPELNSDWSGFQYPPQVDPENSEMTYMQSDEQS
ncbi:hypothetical protein F4818DRAFT_430554 [Hypoxylon cercidicola]|nr:hypothetical protein F4818DRAFT_430554 [Hypoxylon cercidicola]